MRAALALAAAHRPHPNPRVGALVLDKEARVVGKGGHLGPGEDHAEVVALSQASDRAHGGTLVVTLEPCTHRGRTPPCVDAIVAAGIGKVVIGAGDPDPRVAGAGVAFLRAAGLEVTEGVIAEEVRRIDPAYFHHRLTGRPRFTLKTAMTLDGQVAAADLSSQWITGLEAREDAHHLRATMDAVLTGAGTVLSDDPQLTVRLEGYQGPQPRPVVVAGRRSLPATAKVWRPGAIVISTQPVDLPAEVLLVPDLDGLPDLKQAAIALGEAGLLDIVVEGGPGIAGAMWQQGLIDGGVFYLGARLAGGVGRGVFTDSWSTLAYATEIGITDVRRLGADLRVEWVIK
jgi:diaminohydroxyphosphoribosylaminopyrimidine deaminase / 5-amino-6-(5-phosphoribosylamino)uracil reductase